jgi:hypothetical protein
MAFHGKGQAYLDSLLLAALHVKITSRNKSPPFVPLGLHGLFVGLFIIHLIDLLFLSYFLPYTLS